MRTVRNAFRVLETLWAGSLWSLVWVTHTLFSAQSDRHVAGILTGRLFTIETYLGAAAALIALLMPGRGKFLWGYLAAALLVVNEWALRPVMALARTHGTAAGLTFGAWHGVSMVLYVAACLLVLLVVWNEDFR
jgi:hypothetical protein